MNDHDDEPDFDDGADVPPIEIDLSSLNTADIAAAGRVAARYGVRDHDDPAWLMILAVIDAQTAAAASDESVDKINRMLSNLEALPTQIEAAGGEATRKIESDLSNWGTSAASIIAGRLKAMMIDLMPEVEKNASVSINRLSQIADEMKVDINSINGEMRSAFTSARGQYSDDLASSARALIKAGLIKEDRREHRKSLLHNAVALIIAASFGASLFFGYLVYQGQYSPIPIYRINNRVFDLLPTHDFGLSIQKCGGKPCVLIERAKK